MFVKADFYYFKILFYSFYRSHSSWLRSKNKVEENQWMHSDLHDVFHGTKLKRSIVILIIRQSGTTTTTTTTTAAAATTTTANTTTNTTTAANTTTSSSRSKWGGGAVISPTYTNIYLSN